MTPREALEKPAADAASLDRRRRTRGAPQRGASPGPRPPRLRLIGIEERPRWWRDALRRRMLALADVLAAGFASLVSASSVAGSLWALAPLPLWIVLAKLLGLYDRDHRSIRHQTFDELPAIAAWAAAGSAVLAALLPLTPAGSLSASSFALMAVLAATAAFVLRAATRWLWRRLTPPERTAVIGRGDLASATRRKLELFPDMHLKLVEEPELAEEARGGENPGRLEELVQRVDRVIVASEHVDSELIGRLAAVCRRQQVKLSVVSALRGRAGPAPLISQVADLPVLEYDTWDVSRSTVLIKRAFDLAVSAGTVLIFAPLFPLIALAIRLDSKGPVIFSQQRAGINGTPFRMLKFRTMVAGAEESLPEVISLDELPDPMFKLRGDPRVTRVGRFLRRLSLDELPQLVNVLKGEMSIVGPRPEQIDLVERYRPEHRFRLQVKPGMTGPMQVFGRGELTFAERLAVELDYVENMSLARDLRILAQTFPVVLRGTGAY